MSLARLSQAPAVRSLAFEGPCHETAAGRGKETQEMPGSRPLERQDQTDHGRFRGRFQNTSLGSSARNHCHARRCVLRSVLFPALSSDHDAIQPPLAIHDAIGRPLSAAIVARLISRTTPSLSTIRSGSEIQRGDGPEMSRDLPQTIEPIRSKMSRDRVYKTAKPRTRTAHLVH
jgi:hypothetical protein